MKNIKCFKCGKEHNETLENCCWIYCSCGEKICGQCGSGNIGDIAIDNDDEDQYWCCEQCNDCGLEDCTMCI